MQVEAVDQLKNGVLISRIAELDLKPVGLFEALATLAVKKFLN
jgi:hypothetical protein